MPHKKLSLYFEIVINLLHAISAVLCPNLNSRTDGWTYEIPMNMHTCKLRLVC